jgi:protein FRA10AC1
MQADLSCYKQKKVALRWRTETEVFEGKGESSPRRGLETCIIGMCGVCVFARAAGQFVCGHLSCPRREELASWEVNFRYKERGETRHALVKLRLCPRCSTK